MSVRPVDERWSTVWAGSGRAVDRAVDQRPRPWTTTAPSASGGAPLWNAVEGCGRSAAALTRGDAAKSPIHTHPYLHDLEFHHAVGDRVMAPLTESEPPR